MAKELGLFCMGSYRNIEMIFTCPIKVFLLGVQNDHYTEYGDGEAGEGRNKI